MKALESETKQDKTNKQTKKLLGLIPNSATY